MNRTSIEWCRTYAADGTYEEGFSVNPVRFRPHGSDRLVTMCQKVSPGCKNCYAAGIVRRFWPKDAAEPFPGYTAAGLMAGTFELDRAQLLSVLKRQRPARVFWGDMTDLFGDWVPNAFLDACMAVCALTPHLTHIFLTKRPARTLRYLNLGRVNGMSDPACFLTPWYVWREANHLQAKTRRETVCPIGWDLLSDSDAREFTGWPLPNVLLGTSVENQEAAESRLDTICEVADLGWRTLVSFEPLLGQVTPSERWLSLGPRTWAIVGGESGHGARPMHPSWARVLVNESSAAGVPVFFKQFGAWVPRGPESMGYPIVEGVPRVRLTDAGEDGSFLQVTGEDHVWMQRVGKKAAGDLLDGKRWHQFSEVHA